MPRSSPVQIQLMLRTPDGGRWDLIVSRGMERFIGHYSRVPGLASHSLASHSPASDSRVFEYRLLACPRSE